MQAEAAWILSHSIWSAWRDSSLYEPLLQPDFFLP